MQRRKELGAVVDSQGNWVADERSAGGLDAAKTPRRRPVGLQELQAFKVETTAHRQSLPSITLRVEPTDIFIVTFPKCGTTWTQQIVHGLRTRGRMDFEEISFVVPFIEMANDLEMDLEAPQVASPRAFKTHLPWSAVPKGGKYICVVRDPADALLSGYYFLNGWFFERDSLDVREFAEEMFVKNPQRPDRYWPLLRAFWEHKDRDDVLFLCFEDMLQNHEKTVRRIAHFMNLAADDELIALATKQSTLEFMRRYPSQFDDHQAGELMFRRFGLPKGESTTKVRTGRVGDGAQAVPRDVLARLNEIWREEIERPLGIRSYAELRALLQLRGDR
jgi:hypothetical protein